MRERLLVALYFSVAGFFVYIFTIFSALSAMDGGSDAWNTEAWAVFLTPSLLAVLFIFLGVRQHKHYSQKQFKKVTPSKRDTNIFRVLNVLVVIIAGFFIMWGLALLIEAVKFLTALGSLSLGVILIYASTRIHEKFIK